MDITIDDLNPAAGAQQDHLLLAMRAGAAVKLSVEQIATLIVALIVDSAPSTLDTLNELAAALGDDPNFATTITNALAGKSDVGHVHAIANITGLQSALDAKQAAIALGAPQATTSGTAISFAGIPSGVKRVVMNLAGVSTNGNNALMLQLGSASGYEVTGYAGASSLMVGATTATTEFTAGFGVRYAASGNLVQGAAEIMLMDPATNLWAFRAGCSVTGATVGNIIGGGSKALAGALDRIRLTTVSGTDTFDAGSCNILYE